MKITNILAIKNKTSIENSPPTRKYDHFVYTDKSKTNICILIRLKFAIKNSGMNDIKIAEHQILLTVSNIYNDIPFYLHMLMTRLYQYIC
jgi:hypothetical protein